MPHSQQSLPIISGFKGKPFPLYEERLVPSVRTLFELCYPDANPNTSILKRYDVAHLKKNSLMDSQRLDSQLLLQKYSNSLAERISDTEYINQICDELCLNPHEAQYHYALIIYINALFPKKIPDINKLFFANAVGEMTKVFSWYRLGNMKKIDDLKNFESLIGANFGTRTFNDNEQDCDLRRRFSDYRESCDYIDNLYLKAIENKSKAFLSALDYYRTEFLRYREINRSYYRIPPSQRPERNYQLVRECPYCMNWYEEIVSGNGGLKAYCDSPKKGTACFKAWDRVRRSS